ncbi:MAG: DUF4269 domain-containing protein [Bacteroidetes bacterium]|nr:MAG: DUF4269 domain-containing protein [Bacteroidota bacterium]
MSALFENISYLKSGNPRQQAAFRVLSDFRIMEALAGYQPLLAGTIPIGIDIESSDLDILCTWADPDEFIHHVQQHFGHFEQFQCSQMQVKGWETVLASFRAGEMEIEIFGQQRPSHEQPGWRHMIVEQRLLMQHGEDFRQQIIALKRRGIKTEPAFAQVLGLEGDPYEALLEMEIYP